MVQDQDAAEGQVTAEVPVVTDAPPSSATTVEPKAPAGRDRPVGRDWWGVGSAPHRPNVGTLPSQRSGRSYTRSRFLPGLMVLCGATVMVMSTQPWVTAHFLSHTSFVYGTDKAVSTAFGIDGWATFAAGAALLVLSALMMVSEERGLRALAALVAAGTVALAAYETTRVLQKLHYTHSVSARMGPLAYGLLGRAHVGYALIVLGAAAVVAFLSSLAELNSTD